MVLVGVGRCCGGQGGNVKMEGMLGKHESELFLEEA